MRDILTYVVTDISKNKCRRLGIFVNEEIAEQVQMILEERTPDKKIVIERFDEIGGTSILKRLDNGSRKFFKQQELKYRFRCADAIKPFICYQLIEENQDYHGMLTKFVQANQVRELDKNFYLQLFQSCYTDCRNEIYTRAVSEENGKSKTIYDLTDGIPMEIAVTHSKYIMDTVLKLLKDNYSDRTFIVVEEGENLLDHWDIGMNFTDYQAVRKSYDELQSILREWRKAEVTVPASLARLRFSREANRRGIKPAESAQLFTFLWGLEDYTDSMLKYWNVTEYERLHQAAIDEKTGKIQELEPVKPSQTESDEHTVEDDRTVYYVVAKGWKPGIYVNYKEAREAWARFPHSMVAEFYDWTEAEEWYNNNAILFNADEGYIATKKRGIYRSVEEAKAAFPTKKLGMVRQFYSFNEAAEWLKAMLTSGNEEKVYYAVRQGNFKGVLCSYDEYMDAVTGCEKTEAKIFSSYDEAKEWYNEGVPAVEMLGMTEMGEQLAKLLGMTVKSETDEREDEVTSVVKSKKKDKKSKRKEEAADKILPEDEGTVIIAEEENTDGNADKEDSSDSSEPIYDEMAEEEALPEIKQNRVVRKAGEEKSLFKGVQFDKHLFVGMSHDEQKRFRNSFKTRIDRLNRVVKGEVRAAGNSVKLIRKPNKKAVLKRRVGGKRLSMFVQDGIITLMRLSHHDRQMSDIYRYTGKYAGYVYYDMKDFVNQLDSYTAMLEDENRSAEKCSFSEYMSTPAHYVYDEDQQSIIEKGEQGENISIIGNAGAGKSIVGLEWLGNELTKENNESIYLTMSPNLVYTLGYELEKRSLASDKEQKSTIKISTTFDFLKEYAHKLYPEIPENAYLDSAQSMKLFREFWQENVTWESFWGRNNPDYDLHDEASTMLAVWRDIHGIIKGALPGGLDNRDYDKLKLLESIVDESEYLQLLRKEKKSDAKRDVRWCEMIYQTYRRYRDYLKRKELIDDNDMARMILKKAGKQMPVVKYGAAFIDECQDLTQVQLLSLFVLLGDARIKRLASDRCQMVQPTYFSEGTMRTMVNDYDKYLGKDMGNNSCLPQYLHYNYRSSKLVIEFQNYLVQSFTYNNILTLHKEELAEIRCPIMAKNGIRPIWITGKHNNKEKLIHDLWYKMDRSDLQLILSNKESSSKQDFGFKSGTGQPYTDVLSCKGMEYPSVLLYNVMSDMRFDQPLAWKYFYVGATRSNNCLLIYEDSVEENPVLRELLEDAAELELIDKCDDLYSIHESTNQMWIDYIRQSLGENTPENRLETAESALNYGQYDLALDIFQKLGADENLIKYCQGKVYEMYGEYDEAVRIYGTLPAEWTDRGRNRQNSVDQLLGAPDVDEVAYLGAYILSERGSANIVVAAKAAFESKFGDGKKFYDAFGEACLRYEFTQGCFAVWKETIGSQLDNMAGSLAKNVYAEW